MISISRIHVYVYINTRVCISRISLFLYAFILTMVIFIFRSHTIFSEKKEYFNYKFTFDKLKDK